MQAKKYSKKSGVTIPLDVFRSKKDAQRRQLWCAESRGKVWRFAVGWFVVVQGSVDKSFFLLNYLWFVYENIVQ